jgi:hypothetical protein
MDEWEVREGTCLSMKVALPTYVSQVAPEAIDTIRSKDKPEFQRSETSSQLIAGHRVSGVSVTVSCPLVKSSSQQSANSDNRSPPRYHHVWSSGRPALHPEQTSAAFDPSQTAQSNRKPPSPLYGSWCRKSEHTDSPRGGGMFRAVLVGRETRLPTCREEGHQRKRVNAEHAWTHSGIDMDKHRREVLPHLSYVCQMVNGAGTGRCDC